MSIGTICYTNPAQRIDVEIGGVGLTTNQDVKDNAGKIVKFDNATKTVVVATADTDTPYGVLLCGGSSGASNSLNIAKINTSVEVDTGSVSNIVKGEQLKIDANGTFTNTGTGEVFAVAIDDSYSEGGKNLVQARIIIDNG